MLIETVEGNVTHLTNLDNLFADLESKVTAHVANNNVHVTTDNKTAWSAKYNKPTGGIPKTDLASDVQTSLGKADTALQQHQDISALTNHVANNDIHVTADNKTAWNSKYDKPSSGIPKSDLASDVQTSLVPSSLSSDAGKVLTVSNSGDAVWAEATSSGSSGAEAFLVTFTLSSGSTTDSMSFISDKSYSEVVAAHDAGKIVVCSFLGNYFGQLVGVHNNYLIFGVDYLASNSSSAKYVFTIYSDNSVKYTSLSFYNPRFIQMVISAAAWSNGVYSFESDFANMYYDIEVELDSTATSEQLEAWSIAKPTAVFGTNTMKALGDVPTVDIPVIVKVLFNANQKTGSGQQ